MNDTNHNKPGFHPLHGYGIAPASPGLKDHVLRAARDAWGVAPPADIPWTGPLLRLAASLIVAAIPVFLALAMDSKWNAGRLDLVQQSQFSKETDDLLEMTCRPELYRRYAVVAPRRHLKGMESVLKHKQAITDLLQADITKDG